MGSGPLGNLFGLGGKDGGTGGIIGQLVGAITGTPVKAATGGWIRDAGSSKSDSIPAMLSNGEYVVNAKSAGQHGQLLQAINAGRLPAFANGGPVGYAMPSAPRVLPRAAGGGGGTQVIINNSTGQPATQRQDSNGNTHIDIGAMVDNALAERLGSSGGRGATSKLLMARISRANMRG